MVAVGITRWLWIRRLRHLRLFPICTMLFAPVLLLGVLPYMFVLWAILMVISVGQPDAVRQKFMDFVFASYQRLVLFFYEHATGAQVTLYGDVDEVLHRKERALYLSNHQSAVDWVVIDMLAARAAVLGHLRYILKDSIKYIPYFGHILYSQACIYVRRKKLGLEKLAATLRYLKNPDIKSWIVVFPEGTRYNLALDSKTEWIERSRQSSADLGLKPLNHLLFPRSRGLWLMLVELGKSFDAIYDVTLVYEGTINPDTGQRGTAPTLSNFIRLVRPKIHIHIRRIPMCKVSNFSEEEVKNWLYILFLQKDRLLESYYNKDKVNAEKCNLFGAPGLAVQLSRWQTLPMAIFSGVMFVTPFVLCRGWLQYYLWTWVIGALIGYVLLAVAVIS